MPGFFGPVIMKENVFLCLFVSWLWGRMWMYEAKK